MSFYKDLTNLPVTRPDAKPILISRRNDSENDVTMQFEENEGNEKQQQQWAGKPVLATENDMYATAMKDNALNRATADQFSHFSKPFQFEDRKTRSFRASQTRNATTVHKCKLS